MTEKYYRITNNKNSTVACEYCKNIIVKIYNFTPHVIRLICEHGEYEFPSEGVIRCSEKRIQKSTLDLRSVSPYQAAEVPINEVFFTRNVQDLPPFRSDTILIVSRMVAQAYPERTDMVFPDEVLRDADGNIIACRSFARVCMDVNTHGEAMVRLHE